MEPQLGFPENPFDLRYTQCVREALNELPDCFTITDPCISGHPIVFASNGFLKMVGYSKDEVIGRNGRIFQGPDTNRRSVMEIREAIREERAVQLSLLNYRKNGAPFWMLFHMCPVFSKDEGRVINFVGVQVPIMRRSNFCEDGVGNRDVVMRCCRTEVCLETRRVSTNDDREVEINEACDASEVEKTKASAAISKILSVLTHHSELTGRSVCRKRHCLTGNERLAASLHLSLGRIKQSFVLTDAFLPDMPIVYASEAFFKLTGYARHEVLGRNCRLLSGIGTDPTTRLQIKESIRSEQACTIGVRFGIFFTSPGAKCFRKGGIFVGIQIDDQCNEIHELRPETRQLSVVGAVKVAVRSLSMGSSSS